MFKVISKIGSNIGVFDTDDLTVEFHTYTSIVQYLRDGITIEGTSLVNDNLVVSPVKVVVNAEQVIYFGKRLFVEGRELRKENSTTYSLLLDNKRVKFKIESKVDDNRYLVRVSNGLYTIVPNMF